MRFGDRLQNLREETGIKQKDLAVMVNLTRATLYRYEKYPEAMPEMYQVLIKLADIFDTSIDYILGLTDNRERYPAAKPLTDSMMVESMLNSLNSDQLKIIYEKAEVIKKRQEEGE
jgi:transcriptional regulator with XRE-family HTH domain